MRRTESSLSFVLQALRWALFVAMSLVFVVSVGHGYDDGLENGPSSEVLSNGGDSVAGGDSPADMGFADPFEYLAATARFEHVPEEFAGVTYLASEPLDVAPKRPPPPQFG